MIAKARSISHGSAMTNYATKHNRADIVLTRNLGEGLTPLAMWGAMETIHQKYKPKFRRKPVTKPTLRMEVSPSLEETKGWTLKDWYDYAIRFLDEFKKEVQAKEVKKKGKGKFNLDRAQIFACLHFDAKSGIPHLHILINRIDLDGNLMNDSFIGDSAVKAAHTINVERGWELPEDIHEAHEKEITEACYNILRGMASYDWDTYKHGLESRGYKVHEQRDKQGVLHGYTILRGNSSFKSSTLGKGRNLTVPKLEATWKKHRPVAPSVDKQGYTIGTTQTTERKLFPEHNSARQSVAQSKPEMPSVFRKILSVGGKNYSIAMLVDAYTDMKETIKSPDESVPFENVLNVAMLLFMNYVDAATTISESCGGGGSTPSNWGRTMMRMSVRGHDAAPNMPTGYANLLKNIKVHTVKYIRDMSKYSNLVEEIDKQEEVKEQKANLDNELQLLKQTISNLHDSIQKVEKASKDGRDMVKALNAATDSMDMAVFAFCRAVTRAEATVLKVEMTDECLTAIKSAREKLIQAETDLLASHRRLQLQEFRNQNEEIMSFIKSCQGVFLSPKVFWWWAGISYATSLYSLWCLLQLLRHWLK